MPHAHGSPDLAAAVTGAVSRPSIPDYELVRVVGRGSYGDVWLARSVTGAWRAIKVVWRDRFANPEPFEREFRGLKEFAEVSLGESSQMALLHVGRNDALGFFYYVMELADDAERGRQIEPASYVPLTLAEMRLRRGRLPAHECARFGAELARGLASLHRRGLVHRDVKPSNVILVFGVPKLADIGLVAPSASARTFVGTEGYVPPEGPGAPSADVFALARMLYELSTGHDRQEFPKLPLDLARLPDRDALLELNEIFLRACGPAPAERYRDGAAILTDLTALNSGVSLRTRRCVAFVRRITAAMAVIAALGWLGWRWKTRPAPPPPPIAAGISPYSVAVLPFSPALGVGEYFADGFSDEILQALGRERDLRVTGSQSSFWVKGRPLSPPEIAERLGVAYLVEGSLQRSDANYRVQVRLTRGVDGVSENVGTFERGVRDVFALEQDVARAVTLKILHRVTASPRPPSTQNLAAYGAFLRGRAWQVRGAARIAEVVSHFQHAVELDPNFAEAWARLAEARYLKIGTRSPEARGTASDDPLPTVERALALKPDLPLALAVRGFIRGVGHDDSAAGQRDLLRAEELGGANAETRLMRLLVTWHDGEARGLLPLAREVLASNPVSMQRPVVVMGALVFLGAYPEIDALYRQELADLGPERSGTAFINRVLIRRRWRGTDAAQRLVAQAPPNQAFKQVMQARLLAGVGRVAEARALLEGVEPTEKTWSAFAAAGLMDRARSFAEASRGDLLRKLDDPTLFTQPPHVPDGVRQELIALEIALGLNVPALAHLDDWRREMESRSKASYRSAVTSMARFYAMLGQPDTAIAIQQRRLADGGALEGYELRELVEFASLRGDPRFQVLQHYAEAWAASRSDPPDDPLATAPQKSR